MEDELIPNELKGSALLFEKLFYLKDSQNFRLLAVEGHLQSIQNRFLCWRIFLGLLPEGRPASEMVEVAEEFRRKYKEIVWRFSKMNTDHLDPRIFNPLSSAVENPWNNFHTDNQLKGLIKLDVDRTFQDKSLFLLDEVKLLMTNILFTWCKVNSELSYKQGMNDLLGLLVFVAYCDLPDANTSISGESYEILKKLINKSDLEADLYWCFDKLMDRGIRDLFTPVVTKQMLNRKKNDLFTWEIEKNKNDLVNIDKSKELNVSPILRRSHIIHHQLLKTLEPDLYNYMENVKIEPQMYLQRWLRCMLSREFSLHDCLIIWDALLASSDDESGIELLDFMCVAMLKFVESFSMGYLVMQSDHFGILRRLFKFPPVEDVFIIISMAFRMKNPVQYRASTEILKNVGEPEESYCSDVLGNIKNAVEFIDELISFKTFDEYKFQKAVDMVYSIKCQVTKEFPEEFEEVALSE